MESKKKKSNDDGLQFGMKEINSLSRKLDKDKEAQKKFDKIWKKLQYTFTQAMDYLFSEFKIKNYSDLPSENMLIQIASFFYYNNTSQPSIYERNQIRKWFWFTGINSRYSGQGYAKHIISDFGYFRKLGIGKILAYSIDEKVSRSQIQNSDYRSGSSLNKAFFIMLALNEPRYLEGGNKILIADYVALKNKTNKHHIFPKDFLKKKGVNNKKINSLTNICMLVFKENLDANSKAPVEYLNEYRKKKYYSSFLRSHLIPLKVDSGIYGKTPNDYIKFVTRRSILISKKFEKLAGIPLFEK